jgi:hypothetical protein
MDVKKMGMLSDLNEFSLKKFKAFGPLGKLLMVIAYFIAVSAITTLADVVFQWKGFILQGVKFYVEFVVNPLILFSSYIGLKYDRNEIHAAVLGTISILIGMRLLADGQIAAYKIISARYKCEVKPNLVLYRAIGITFPIGIWLWYGLTEQSPNFLVLIPIVLLYPVFIVIPKIIMTKFDKGAYFEKEEFSYFVTYYAYVAYVLLAVGVLGAINLGLTRST